MLPPKRRINYSQVMNQVSQIKGLSTGTNKVSQDLDDVLKSTMKVWGGDAANEFKRQCGSMIIDISNTARRINELANKISSVASDIKSEDDAAQRRYQEYLKEQQSKNE
jgi:uncharacterized protein YukE